MVLKGSNGYDVGSPEYFKNINQSSIVGDIMWEYSNGSHCVDYRDALDKLCKSVVDVIYEVHADLKRYAEVLSFFPKEEREETLKFLEKINEVLKFGYSNASTFDACKAYLTLSAYDTKRKSYESMSRVEESAKKVENGNKVSFSTGMEYIRKALDYGINFTIGDDSEKKAFFDDVLDGKDKDFLQDVYNFLKFKKEKSSLQGKCFKTILSKDYIEKLSCEAISSRLYDKLKYERSYYEVIKSGFETVAEHIKKDLQYYTDPIDEDFLEKFINTMRELKKISGVDIESALRDHHIDRKDNDVKDLYTLADILKLLSENGEIFEFNEWDHKEWIPYLFKRLSKQNCDISVDKSQYVVGISNIIKKASKFYDIPAVMIAGVAYNEFGGDPLFVDDVKYKFFKVLSDTLKKRYITTGDRRFLIAGEDFNNIAITTSFGNISMQIRRASETMGYDETLTKSEEELLISLLKDEKTAIFLVAAHLKDLMQIDFPNINSDDLTIEEMSIVVGRYQQGPDVSKEKARTSGYANDFLYHYDKLQELLMM